MQVASPIPKKHARIEIIPLIDIMFFLLASFMMVSLSQTHMKGIRIQLPGVNPPPPGPKDYISIRVGAGGIVSFNGEVVLNEQVLPRLFQLHAANPDVKVSISAEGMARHGDVITVLDSVRQVGIQKVGYQIRAAGGGAPAPGAPGAPPGAPGAPPGAPGAPPAAPPPPPPH